MANNVVNADVELPAAPSSVHRIAAEIFGTFVLVLGAIGTALFSSADTGLLGVALAVGLAVIGAAYAVGHISGGHFNPAVTVGAAMAGRFAWREVPMYLLAQVVGAALATTVLFGIAAGGPGATLSDLQGAGFASNGFGEQSPGGFGLASVLLAELVLTAILVYVVLGVTDRRAPSGFAPLGIGLTLTAIHLVAIPVSNASFNPARSIATAIFGGPDALVQLWVFIVAPIAGALLAGATYRVLFDRQAQNPPTNPAGSRPT